MKSLKLLLVQIGSEALIGSQKLKDADFPCHCHIVHSSTTISADSFNSTEPDLVVVSHTTDCKAALEMVRCVRRLRPGVPIILLSQENSETFIADDIQAGVTRHLQSPWTASRLATVIGELSGQTPCVAQSREDEDELRGSCSLVGKSASMCELRRYIRRIAPTESNVLITGETGTGKELVAQLIHENSGRSRWPFVCLNSAAIPDSLVESELFGYEKGAFTGAQARYEGKLASANRGTAFFDEIGDVSLAIQAKLLRAIESRKIYRLGGNCTQDLDFRILAATNQNLEAAMAQHQFRRDLYYRLNVIHIEIPPLRDRIEDLPALVEHQIRHFNRVFGKNISGFKLEAMGLLLSHSWPGNVRELRNVLEATFANLSSGEDGIIDLPPQILRRFSSSGHFKINERTLLVQALNATNWNKTKAAKELHWSRMKLYRKMSRYQIISLTNEG